MIRERLLDRSTTKVVLDLNVGKIPVTFEDEKEILWMSQIEPSFATIHDREDIAGVIGLQAEDLDDRFPIQGVSTGIEFLMIPLKNLSAVRKAATDLSRYNRYFADTDPMPLFLFCPETYEQAHAINCRMFADALGVPEDPATGSANGCLAAYLVNHRYFGSDSVDISVEQGYEIGRESVLHIRANREDGRYNIRVGGKVVLVAEGEIWRAKVRH